MTDYDKALAGFRKVSAAKITDAELQDRISRLQAQLRKHDVRAVWLDASSSLTYFTGISLGLSERLHGAIIPASGPVIYVSPAFEVPKLLTLIRVQGEVVAWDEHVPPCPLVVDRVRQMPGNELALDPATPFVFASAMMNAADFPIISAQSLIVAQRQIKSTAEIAIMQAAMDGSVAVHRAVHAGLQPGISTTEVCDFINAAHIALGMKPLFAAAQFGEATAYPHGVPEPQRLKDGDMVLVDLGATLNGYQSDITRTYVFGRPTKRQEQLWWLERSAQEAAFAAARVGATCGSVDAAARSVIEAAGFGPGYAVPGLPHRTGHGLGMDIHEEPYIVGGNESPLEPGMCFSIEPMLCVYGECGVRLEDIVYLTEAGPRWFSPPSVSPTMPFPSEHG